ncbi:hypothetical protein [Porcipelethomonas sp.]|uniref:hypothetical protein n=1 Tax=Porcipelethomonas sp. TaxID=2981675 RepID=UPI003EF6E1C0
MANKNNIYDSEDVTGRFDTDDIEQNKVISAIGYIPVLFLVPMLATQSPYAKFHANQGLILTLAAIVLNVAQWVLGKIFGMIPFFRSFVPEIISFAVGVAVLIYIIIGVMNAAQGKAKKLPFIGNLLDIIH